MNYINLYSMGGRNHCCITNDRLDWNGKENTRDQVTTFVENGTTYLYFSGSETSVRFDWKAEPQNRTSFNFKALNKNMSLVKDIPLAKLPNLLPLCEKIKAFTFAHFNCDPKNPLPSNFAQADRSNKGKETMDSFFTEIKQLIKAAPLLK